MKQGQYLVLVQGMMHRQNTVHNAILNALEGDERFHDCGEGPWEDYEAAEAFARNEVGMPWIIVRVVSTEGVRV